MAYKSLGELQLKSYLIGCGSAGQRTNLLLIQVSRRCIYNKLMTILYAIKAMTAV